MKKTRFGGFFFVCIICTRQDAGNNVLRNPDKLRRTRRQVEDSTSVRQDADNNVLRNPDKLRRTRHQVEDSTLVRRDAGNNVLRNLDKLRRSRRQVEDKYVMARRRQQRPAQSGQAAQD
ncbi:hypothetical protein [Janthinobacterium sp.]|uniref:hypothetical protein n=1 Tax=Janthinobacterium sp. TaxID=1871054 RepID=UPI002DB76528|nr:hypothetical protein [Janthinobacterium sp.]HEU4816170.1 hypothetical protein [Janthinobacterium sp.]